MTSFRQVDSAFGHNYVTIRHYKTEFGHVNTYLDIITPLIEVIKLCLYMLRQVSTTFGHNNTTFKLNTTC